jgi:hypothetical protein
MSKAHRRLSRTGPTHRRAHMNGVRSIKNALRPVCSAAIIARTASSTGFSVKWTIACGFTFFTDQTSGTLAGRKNKCAAPSRQP